MQLKFDKRAICDKIYNLVDTQTSLKTTKNAISNLISEPFLPSLLENYVEYKYFKYCIQHLEVSIKSSNFLVGLSTSQLIQTTTPIFTSRQLENLHASITQIPFYKLIWEERRLLSDEDQQAILFRIQVAVAFVANSLTSSAESKQSSLAAYMRLSKQLALTLQSVIQRQFQNEPAVSHYSGSKTDQIWNYAEAVYSMPCVPVQEYRAIYSNLQAEFDNFVRREFGDDISLFKEDIDQGLNQINAHLYTPANIAVQHKSGRYVLTIKKPVILLGTLLNQIEDQLRAHPEVEEVHFVASEVMYIDRNLRKEVWHGKNVLVICKKIETVLPSLLWDLSGNAGRSVNQSRAADWTQSDIDGKDGENAQPGESAGYSTFIADEFLNMNRLTVKMTGGSGGNGQNGGHGKKGKDGENGAEMSSYRLLNEFESPAKLSIFEADSHTTKIVQNLKNVIVRFERTPWSVGLDSDTGSRSPAWKWAYYVKGYTADGMLIEFGYYGASYPFNEKRHSYLLVRGAPGTSGELGGFGGCKGAGGKGGNGGNFAAFKLSNEGTRMTCNINIDSGAGHDGDNGQDGDDGKMEIKCGQNGRDIGYVDNMWSPESKGKVYGPGGPYEVVNEYIARFESVWCEYKEKWRSIKYASRDQPQPLQNNRQRRNRMTEKVAAAQKNTIDYSQVMYEHGQDVKRNFTVGGDMEETEFQKKIADVITKSKEFMKKNQRKDEDKLKKKEKINVNKAAPQRGRFKNGMNKQTRRSRVKNFLSAAKSGKPGQKISGQNQTGNDILFERFKVLEKIRLKMESGWKYDDKMKIDYIKHPTSRRGYASALHALFGELNSLGFYETKNGKRKEVCEHLKNNMDTILKNKEAQVNLRESLFAYFEDKSEDALKNKSSSKKQSNEKGDKKSTLEKYCETFKQDRKNFQWETVLSDSKAIEEYIDFLGEPMTLFLISDLRIVANLFGIPTELYMSFDGSSVHVPLKQKIPTENKEKKEEKESSSNKLIRIAVNEQHEFCRMVQVEQPDWSEVHQQMNTIVKEVASLKDRKEVEEYLKMEKFGVKIEGQEKEKKGDADELNKLAMITAISDLFGVGAMNEEKLVVGTALQMWPELLLITYFDRIVVSAGTDNGLQEDILESLKHAFGKVTEAILNGNDDQIKLAHYLWIIATCPIEQWTLEMSLLSLQEHFIQAKYVDILVWREMMSPFPSKLVECIEKLVVEGGGNDFDKTDKQDFNQFINGIKTFELSSLSDMDFSKLDPNIGKSHWRFQLRKLYIASRVNKLPNVLWDNASNKLSQSLYYLHALYNEKPKEVKCLLDQLHIILKRQCEQATEITKILQNFYGGLWTLTPETIELLQNSKTLKEWMDSVANSSLQGLGQARSLEEIQKIIENDYNCTVAKDDLLQVIELVKSIDNFILPPKLQTNFQGAMTEWLNDFKIRIKNCEKTDLPMFHVEAVTYINLVVKMKLGYSLHPTQKLAILVALHQGSIKDTNLLSQIATGEGKTCVVLSVAIYNGLVGKKTDVVTSSKVLAQRDATLYEGIYSAFNLTVGDVTSYSADDRRKAYLCNVVYGEACHFQRDYLLDRFYNQNIRGSRPFGNIIVDEVDSMFLDKGNSVLYLSHQPPDLDSLEGLFVFIWTCVVQLVNSGEYHPMKVEEIVLSDMYPTIRVDDLLLFLSAREVHKLWDWLVAKKVINSNGRLLNKTCDLPQLPDRFKHVEKRLKYLIQCQLDSPGKLKVFNYLKPFVEQHLFAWIHSAYQATQLNKDKEYVVDVDRSKTVLDKLPRIMILDLDTGVDMKDSQWNEALHQFLQFKHAVRQSLMNLKAVFISNISFFNKYGRIFGLTGTIGTESDRKFLKDTYNVNVLCVPLVRPKRFIEQEPIICENIEKWKAKVYEDAIEKTGLGRSVLVVCGTVHEAEVLFAHFKDQKKEHAELYRRDYEKFEATEEGRLLAPGAILITTNLAGRGTDIKLSQGLKDNGGLHVILSYLPDNLRVEQQAFGRAARCGDLGSGRLIFVDQVRSAKKTGDVDAIDMKIQRDELEISRVSDIQNYYNTVIVKEEEMFKTFQKSFEELTGTLNKAYKYVKDHLKQKSEETDENRKLMGGGNIEEMKELVMYSMLNDWAYWLDKYSTILLNKNNEDHATLFDKGLHKFDMDQERNMHGFMKMTEKYERVKEKYQDPNWMESVLAWSKNLVGIRGDAGPVEEYALTLIHEPALLVKVAKVKIERGQYEEAESYLDKVISKEPENGRVAKYYKLFCMVKRGTWKGSDKFQRLKEEVGEDLDDWRSQQSTFAGAVTKLQILGDRQCLHGEGYKKQKVNMMRLIGTYMQSVQSMVGNERLMASDFGMLCGEGVGEHLMKYLVDTGALRDTTFATQMKTDNVKKLAVGFCLGEDQVKIILDKFKGRTVTPNVEKDLKKDADLPSRGGFWKEIEGCLEEVESFAVVQAQTQLSAGEPVKEGEGKGSSCEKNDYVEWAKSKEVTRRVLSKYGTDMGPSTNALMVLKGKKIELKKEQKFKFLRNSGRLCHEQVGLLNVDKLKKLKLKKFCKIEKDSFLRIEGVNAEESLEIVEILREAGIVDGEGELLTVEWTKDKVDFTEKWEVYRWNILSTLQSKCRYKYEVLSILSQDESLKTDENISISLPSKPCKDFIMTCLELGLIHGHRANPSYFEEGGVGNFFINVFREPASWAAWVFKKTGIVGNEKPKLTQDDLVKLFPEENQILLDELYNELKEKSWVNSGQELILDLNTNENFQLSSKFEFYQPSILSLVQWRLEKVKEKFLKDALKIVYESQGKLKTLENPDAKLVDIEELLSGTPATPASKTAATVELTEELATLNLSGFDHVIDTTERKYTIKMIFSTIAIIILGLAQIGFGIFLGALPNLGFGTFIASGLIAEGFSDLIYGIMAFRSGHFSWQDWVDYKWRSIAITAAITGIGALLARGIKYSKIGEKLFGSFGKQMGGRAVQETLKQGGKAGIKRSIWPTLLKSFGYKVIQGCAIAGGSIAVSYAYDKALKKYVDNVSANIFANTDEVVRNHPISGTLSELCDNCGVTKAQEIVDRCSVRVLADSTCEADVHQQLSYILIPLLGGLKEATGKMNRAGTFSNQEGMTLMILMKVCAGVMATASVLNSLEKMKESVKKYIDQVEREIKKELEVEKTQPQFGQQQRPMATEGEKQDFISQFTERTRKLMKQKIGGIMQHTIIEPLMNVGCQKLLWEIGKKIRGKYGKYTEGKLLGKMDKIKFELNQNPDSPEAVKRDLHKQVLQLCCKSRDPKVIAYAVEFGGPLGVESVQALANMLGVTIVVESNSPNIPKVFEPEGKGPLKRTGTTLHLKHTVSSDDPHDLGHWESVSGGGGERQTGASSGSPDCLLDAINSELKFKFGDGGQKSRGDLADFMRTDEKCKEFVNNGWHHTFNSVGGFGGAKRFEEAEVRGEDKDNTINKLLEKRRELREKGKMRRETEKDRLDPIHEFATENLEGRECSYFVSGEVTKATMDNKQSRQRSNAKEYVMEGECSNRMHNQAGHLSPVSWGAPTAIMNLFAQNSHVNNSVNKSVERTVTDFVNANPKSHSVEYISALEGRNGRWAGGLVHYFRFKVNGVFQYDKVFKLDNHACNCPPPERRNRGPVGR